MAKKRMRKLPPRVVAVEPAVVEEDDSSTCSEFEFEETPGGAKSPINLEQDSQSERSMSFQDTPELSNVPNVKSQCVEDQHNMANDISNSLPPSPSQGEWSTNSEFILAEYKDFQHICQYCKLKFPFANLLRDHQLRFRKFCVLRLPETLKILRDISPRVNLTRMVPPPPVLQPAKKASPLNLPCNFCPRIFQSKFYFKKHLRSHRSSIIAFQRNSNKKTKRIEFESKDELETEMLEQKFAEPYQLRRKINPPAKYVPDQPKPREIPIRHNKLNQKGSSILLTSQSSNNNQILRQNLFNCDFCKKMFLSKSGWFEHLKEAHPDLQCQFCSLSFAEFTAYWNHRKLTHPGAIIQGQSYSCPIPICSEKSEMKSTILDHYKRIHLSPQNLIFPCSECPQKFRYLAKIQAHSKTHLSCHNGGHNGEKYKRLNDPKDHVNAKHDSNIVFPTLLPKSILKEKRNHMIPPDQIKLKSTLRSSRPKGSRNNNQILRQILFSCEFCKKTFLSNKERLEHLDKVHPDFKCQFCDLPFPNLSSYWNHRKMTHPGAIIQGQTYSCPISTCSKKTLKKDSILVHYKRIHLSQNPLYSCNKCLKKFLDLSQLQDHSKTHVSQTCPFCFKEFALGKGIKSLKNHIKSAHASPYPCPECSEILYSPEKLTNHFKSQHTSSDFTCMIGGCGRVLAPDGKGLILHIRAHSQSRSSQYSLFFCTPCKVAFETPQAQEEHLRVFHQEGFNCSLCGVVSKTCGEYEKHQRILHNGGVANSQPYSCPTCPTINSYETPLTLRVHFQRVHWTVSCRHCSTPPFSSSYQLSLHLRAAHPETVVVRGSHKEKILGESIVKRRYICQYCGKKYAWKSLKDHINECHSQTPAYHCAQCPRVFQLRSIRYDHMKRMHSGASPPNGRFMCSIPGCGEMFKTIRNMKNHINYHTSQILFFCTPCKSTFLNQDALYQHLNSEHPSGFECPICETLLKSQAEYSSHHKNAHSEVKLHDPPTLYTCPSCPNQYEFQHTLLEHYKKEHGICCPHCESDPFLTQDHFEAHLMKVHSEEVDLPFVCGVEGCGSGFGMKADYEKPLESHSNMPGDYVLLGEGLINLDGLVKLEPIESEGLEQVEITKQLNKSVEVEKETPSQAQDSNKIVQDKNKASTASKSRKERLKHMKLGLYPCPICRKTFTSTQDRSSHFTTEHHSDFKCPKCQAELKTLEECENHKIQGHFGDLNQLYTCPKCPSRFLALGYINVHMKFMHSNKCPECDKVFDEREEMFKHSMSEHVCIIYFSCPYCPNSFSDETQLNTHIGERHKAKEGVKIEERRNDKLAFRCAFCREEFRSRPELGDHMNKQHTYPCPKCSEFFYDPRNLINHKANAHPEPSTDKNLTCPYPDCEKTSFDTAKDLLLHLRKSHETGTGNGKSNSVDIINTTAIDPELSDSGLQIKQVCSLSNL